MDPDLASLVEVADHLGVAISHLSRRIYNQNRDRASTTSPRSLERKFGSWNEAKRLATLAVAPEDPRRAPQISFDWDDSAPDTIPDLGPERCDRYVITYAQNATPINDDFFASLLAFCEHRGAKLLVIPGRYKNPTSIWSEKSRSEERWDPRLDPYLLVTRESSSNKIISARRVRLCESLLVASDISIQPTAVRPLTGFEVFAGQGSCIFGHPKIQLKSIAGSRHGSARTLASTGAVTVPNYTHSKAGKKAEAHHVFGALSVEISGDSFSLRQINATSDGSFIDLNEHFSPYGVEEAPRPLALIMGDIHVATVDSTVLDATLRDGESIAKTLRPEKILYHDTLDFRSRNHHEIKNPDKVFERHVRGDGNVDLEVQEAIDFLEATPDFAEPVVVKSNHDAALDRWLRDADPKRDPLNAVFYHKARSAKLEHYQDNGEWVSAFELLYRERGSGRVTFVSGGYQIAGIECGFHGDLGTNGARSSILSYARLGEKTVIGHSHSPAILDGCYQVGVTGKLDQGYNKGPSSWQHAHCIIYANGKRSLIFVDRESGKWRY